MKIQWLKKVAAVYCALGFALLTAIPTKAAETAEKTVSEYAVSSYTGLANYGDNVWRYQINGVVQETYTGLVEYYGNAISSSQLNSTKLNKVPYNPVFP